MLELLKAELIVALNCSIVSGVFYGLYTLLTAASFDGQTYAVIAGALFAVANVAFVAAKLRRGSAWTVAKHFTED